jgi:hypothetical protein
MRASMLGVVLFVALLFPIVGSPQAFQFRTPDPQVTAAGAAWQINGEPVVFQGLVYYPTRESRFFDGQVMTQIGVYQGVPIYADTTLEPYSLTYVPVGRNVMRAYERLRDRDLAGTTGSRVPTFPVAGTSAPPPVERVVGTAGTIVPPPVVAPAPILERPARTAVESIPRPSGANGVWIQFNGTRWYSDGEAVPYSPDRFAQIGDYRGFPVYRDKSSTKNQIWVAVVKDGPLAPYAKR